MPWRARHAIAAAPTRTAAYALLDRYADNPDGAALDFAGDLGNAEYAERLERWAATNASPDALYEATYGAEALAAAKRAEAEEREDRRAAAERQLEEISGETI